MDQQLKYYFINSDFTADNLDAAPAGTASKAKTFKKGDLVIGTTVDSGTEKAIITPDGYNLPVGNITEVIDQEAAKTLSEAKQRIDQVVNRDFIRETIKSSKYSVNGAGVGIVVGIVFSMATKRSMIFSAFIGAFIGGAIGYRISKNTVTK